MTSLRAPLLSLSLFTIKMRTNQASLQDPNQALPFDLFSHLLSFLPPASIATSSAICSQWRSSIMSTPTLHREIDLSNLGKHSSPQIINNHLNSLSALALYRVKEVSLNLSSLWEEFMRSSSMGRFMELNSLLDILDKSRETLTRISFKVGAYSQVPSMVLKSHTGSLFSLLRAQMGHFSLYITHL